MNRTVGWTIMAENKNNQDISDRTRYLLAAILICSALLLGVIAPVKAADSLDPAAPEDTDGWTPDEFSHVDFSGVHGNTMQGISLQCSSCFAHVQVRKDVIEVTR